ncbi:hypothetical protein JD844_001359 [Phrynosoma platyrhinos]|uniref:CDP-diacylglycerol--inositol 3-phosphatidyltransferase n=1 Tax=Phrynosoma platyrhinos TaxID=52577 RepID=A0ABQ7T9W4_PHRPL|nr:hypothetical protein JD844_001359 [Phrynosoma platyrhinos]
MKQENIFLFVPNLIGYARIIFAFFAFYFMPTSHLTASFFYLLSGFLDAFDGHAARVLNQGTRFGAMLDMLTDRCATMCLLVNLAMLYPESALWFQLSMSLDIASHWLHLHSTVVKGGESHKSIDLSGNRILRVYYSSRPVLFIMCAVLPAHVGLYRLVLWACAPIAIIKSLISLIHLVSASCNMAALDAAERAKRK